MFLRNLKACRVIWISNLQIQVAGAINPPDGAGLELQQVRDEPVGPDVLLERVAAHTPLNHQARLNLMIMNSRSGSGTRIGGRATVAAAAAATAVVAELIRRRAEVVVVIVVCPEGQGRHWQALEVVGAWECVAVVTVHGACGEVGREFLGVVGRFERSEYTGGGMGVLKAKGQGAIENRDDGMGLHGDVDDDVTFFGEEKLSVDLWRELGVGFLLLLVLEIDETRAYPSQCADHNVLTTPKSLSGVYCALKVSDEMLKYNMLREVGSRCSTRKIEIFFVATNFKLFLSCQIDSLMI